MSGSGAIAARVLVVDDDVAIGKVLVAQLGQAGYRARHVASAEAGLAALGAEPFDAVLSDVRMPGRSGMDLLGDVAAKWPDLPVILLTAFGTIPLAVEAMRRGASDFMLKPFDRDELLLALQKALLKSDHAARGAVAPAPGGGSTESTSPAMIEVLHTLVRAAAGNATVLLRGETGTGKGLAARRLHEASARRAGPFVTVQCGALPDNLLESELFGYEKGAFTGATCRKPGRVELAKGGTLFLDEIGDVSLPVQVKLLRLLQDRAYERLGGTETLTADVRFVAATHQPLEELVARRTFREDLFYRLHVIPLVIPPLRDRADDVGPLARAFAATFSAAGGKRVTLSDGAIARLRAQRWPGNVRQLENFVERIVVLADDGEIDGAAIDRARAADGAALAGLTGLTGLGGLGGQGRSSPPTAPGAPGAGEASLTLDVNRRSAEKEALTRALERAAGNRTLAARLLGVSRRTLYNKLEEHDLA